MGGGKERHQGSLPIACVWVEGGVTCTSGEERKRSVITEQLRLNGECCGSSLMPSRHPPYHMVKSLITVTETYVLLLQRSYIIPPHKHEF